MKITKIQFNNFMGYNSLILPREQDEELPEGLIIINGRNSHGKSTILEGVIYAFFGPQAFKMKNAESFITYGESTAEIYVYFILDKTNYYIYRKWSRSNSSIAKKLFRLNTTSGNYEEIKSFDIEDFFEITKDQALSTVFVKQGEIEELASKKGATVRDMILKLFRLDIIDKTLKALDKDKSEINGTKEKLQKRLIPIPRIEQEIEELKVKITDNENSIIQKTGEKKIKDDRLKELPSQELLSALDEFYKINDLNKNKFESNRTDFIEKIKTTEFKVDDKDLEKKIKQKIESLEASQKELEKEKEELQSQTFSKNQEKGGIQNSIKESEDKIAKMEDSLSFTEDKVAKCPLCQNDLSKEHYDEIVTELQQGIEENTKNLDQISSYIKDRQAKLQECSTNLDNINKELISVKNIHTDYSNFNKYQEELVRSQKELDEFIAAHDEIGEDLTPEKISKLKLEVQALHTELRLLDSEITTKMEDVKQDKEKIITKEEEIKKMQELEKQIEDIEVDLIHLSKVKDLVKRFVTEYMVTKRLIKNISIKAERYIKEFTAGQYGSLMIDLAGSTKTGLALKVKDHFNGVNESIEMLSGGDRTSLGMALRLAISELMKVIRPTKDSPKNYPKIDFLLLDEPLAALDEERRKRILKHLVKSKAFSQVFLITHTSIPSEIQANRIFVTKSESNGESSARFERQFQVIEKF